MVYIIFDICNLFYSCCLNCITGEIIVILIIYLHDFIFPLSFILLEHQNNNTTATIVVTVISDNWKSLFMLILASLQ